MCVCVCVCMRVSSQTLTSPCSDLRHFCSDRPATVDTVALLAWLKMNDQKCDCEPNRPPNQLLATLKR